MTEQEPAPENAAMPNPDDIDEVETTDEVEDSEYITIDDEAVSDGSDDGDYDLIDDADDGAPVDDDATLADSEEVE